MPSHVFRLTLQSTYQESEKVPDFIAGLQKKSDLNDDEISTLMLLVSEAVSNAIEHGNHDDPSKKVFIEISVSESQIVAGIKDEGEGFDPDKTRDPLEQENLLDSGGRGVFLIRELSDSVEYLDGGTKVLFRINR